METPLHPTLWRTCRALANEERLIIMSILHDKGRMTVTQMAHETRCPINKASEGLRALNARGLLRAHRIGRYVYYEIGSDPSVAGSSTILKGLLPMLSSGTAARRRAFKILTGFTHPRRHVIVFHLNANHMTFYDLRKSVNCSNQALRRHIRKLRDRRFVQRVKRTYRLAHPRDSLRQALLELATLPP